MGDENTSIFGVPPPDPELKSVEPLVGTWRTEDHTEDSVLGPGVPVRSTETYSWLDGLRVTWWAPGRSRQVEAVDDQHVRESRRTFIYC
jgi:hypothetical protein